MDLIFAHIDTSKLIVNFSTNLTSSYVVIQAQLERKIVFLQLQFLGIKYNFLLLALLFVPHSTLPGKYINWTVLFASKLFSEILWTFPNTWVK